MLRPSVYMLAPKIAKENRINPILSSYDKGENYELSNVATLYNTLCEYAILLHNLDYVNKK